MNHNFSSSVTIALLLSVVMPPDFSMASEPSVRRHFGMDAPGNDRGMWIRHVGTVDDCENICLADPGCAGYTYNARRSTCIPKNRIGQLILHGENPITGVILGPAGDTAIEVSSAGEPGNPQTLEVKDGIYCVQPTSRNNGELADGVLAVRQESHDALEIGLLVSYPERNDAVSALGGLVKKVATNHWLYLDDMDSSNPDDHCALDIVLEQKGWHFTTRKAAECINDKGHDAVPASLPTFPLNSYVGQVTNQLDKPENLTNINCSLPYTPAPARETPGAPAHAKSGQLSYVGRWMDNPSCRPPIENELRFSNRGMDGDELSCRFDRIRGGSGRWHIRMTCHGEGGTERREVDILVDGNTMQFKEGGETSKKTRCP